MLALTQPAFWSALYRGGKALVERTRRDDGQALVEYALILALIAVLTVAILAWLGFDVAEALNTVENAIDGDDANAPVTPGGAAENGGNG